MNFQNCSEKEKNEVNVAQNKTIGLYIWYLTKTTKYLFKHSKHIQQNDENTHVHYNILKLKQTVKLHYAQKTELVDDLNAYKLKLR